MILEITKLIKKSPKREVIFKKFADDIKAGSPGIRTLCPTRWTVRAEALTSISENYQALQSTWEAAKQATKDSEMRARITGVASQIEGFDYFFGVELGRKCLSMVDNLSRALQSATMSACEGQGIVRRTVQSLQSIRTDENFDLFWQYLERRCSKVNVSTPTLPRCKRVPRRFEIGEGAPEYPDTVQNHYQRIYFEVLDVLKAAIEGRFQQKGFQMLQKLEAMLVDKNLGIEVAQEVIEFYGDDLHQERLRAQLLALHSSDTDRLLSDLQAIISYLRTLNEIEMEYYSEVIKVAKLILVMPATNALSERSFSALRRIKTWLRTTTNQVRLNNCMTLHVHKTKTDSMLLLRIGNEFIQRNSSRMNIFGQYTL